MPEVLRDKGLSNLLESPAAPLETIASGLVFTEGPLELPGGTILFQDIKAEKTYRIRPGSACEALRSDTGAANGQTLDNSGAIVFCEQTGRRVSRMDLEGKRVAAVAEAFEGKRLNSPNDIICRSDGVIFFTDPPYGVLPEHKELPFQGVFALSSGGELSLLAADFEKPNGLALSPDEKTLYVCDTAKYHIRAFDVIDKYQYPSLANERVFATMDPGEPGGPDGMKVDAAGRVYAAVALGIWVYEPDGGLLGILRAPKRPSNLAWSGPGATVMVITAVDQVHRTVFRTQGVLPPIRGRIG